MSAASSATSVGVWPTRTPFASSASFFATAVPCEPEMIAPAWPIVLPGGAVKPAMYARTGFETWSAMYSAVCSSASPPISPHMTINSVWSSCSNCSMMSMKCEPAIGSPPMPTIELLPNPRWASSLPIWYVKVPDRETRPTLPSEKKLAGMMPTLALPGDRMPGQLGPTRRTPGLRAMWLSTRSSSWAGRGGDGVGDRDDQLDAGVLGLEDRVGGEARRDEDHRRVRARLGDGVVERVEDRRPLDVLAALAGRHARDEVRPVALVVHRVERALAPRDARDAELCLLSDEDAHPSAASRRASAAPRSVSVPSPTGTVVPWGSPELPPPASSTTRWAAPSIVDSVCTLGRSACASSSRPSLSFVPSRRTTNGTSGWTCSNASISPLATSSQRVMPPKMLNSTAVTFGLERITSTAEVIASALEPPPASRKLAGEPPAWATTSSVDITRPAPLPRMPTSPSSLT